MTSREKTAFLTLDQTGPARPLSEKLFTMGWGAIQWPWLARSLWGGRLADKHALLDRLGLPHDALPHLGSWKADTYFLWRILGARHGQPLRRPHRRSGGAARSVAPSSR